MFSNDYIMRMIEQLVAGIAMIMGLKKENKLEESAEVLTGTLRRFFGLNDQSVEKLPYEDLMAVSSLGGQRDAVKCAMLAQLIKEKADLASLNGGEDTAAGLYLKALNIYITALLDDHDLNTQSSREGINEITGIVETYELPQVTMHFLFDYFELTGRYAKAEDTLYEMMKSPENREEAAKAGREFYARLLEKSDDDLINGNLPRDEVLEGMKQINSYENSL